ncbi:IS3 family transposase [Mycobacterium sp.]|uniref:IS3 family transposase n=1 Tax=Mycobacterium sp. TaxID=1785 RepID=UPI00344D4E33
MWPSTHAPSGFEKRWAGRDVTVHRLPEGTLRHHARHDCRALGVSQSWFYKWRHSDPSSRHARRRALTADIGRLFAAHKGKYRSLRSYAELRDEGCSISVNTVATIMREQGMVARPKRHRRHGTRPGKGRWRAADLANRKFAAQQLNGKWYGDGTEVHTNEGTPRQLPGAVSKQLHPRPLQLKSARNQGRPVFPSWGDSGAVSGGGRFGTPGRITTRQVTHAAAALRRLPQSISCVMAFRTRGGSPRA